MKIRNNARTGVIINIILLVIALAIFLIVNSIPNVDYNTLNTTSKLMYDLGANKGKTPTWKIVWYVIVIILLIIGEIVNFIMCRCHHCRRHIYFMNIFMMYCPYCSKSLYEEKSS